MSIQLKANLSQFWHSVQGNLFPWLEEVFGPLSDEHQKIIMTLEMARVEDFVQFYRGVTLEGRRLAARASRVLTWLKLH